MNAEENKKIMARNIKRYMEAKGITKRQVCDDLGFKYTTFVDWINGVTYPRIGKVEAMANYFGCEKSDLIEDKDGKEKAPDKLSLTEGEKMMLELFRLVPEDQQPLVLEMIRAALKSLK